MQRLQDLLRQSALKVTSARVAVLDFLSKAKYPQDAEEIYAYFQSRNEKIDRATVYRILDVFLEKGLIQKVEFGEGRSRFELRRNDHHHLICEKCGSVADISDCRISDLEKQIKQKKYFLVKRHTLEFFGICRLCQ